MERNKTDTDRGQVGIGTLIVFIAMVLVAAIAAGVLINTAGFLQTQAEDTGEQSTDQVANNLNVITEVGTVGSNTDAGDDQIGEIRVGVQPAAGADDINLAELTVQYVSDSDFANLVVAEDASGDTSPPVTVGDASEDEYGVELTTAENPGDIVMTDSSDRYELVISLGQSSGEGDQSSLTPLDEGEEVELTITTDVGSQTVAFLQVPDSLSAETSDDTVNL